MADAVIENPTYLEHIRYFFEPVDVEHMGRRGIDLSTYEGVKSRATSVYLQTKPPNASMPPEEERKWSAERSETFANWVRTGFPLGEPIPNDVPTQPDGTTRVRKDASALSPDEIEALARAFEDIMARGPSDPTGYFGLAATHWYPAPNECLHHEARFLPWHRVYVTKFEDALRSAPGAESVTLPYWDITQPPPEFLYAPPFASYELPVAIHANYPAGYVTTRFDRDTIAANVKEEEIPAIIEDAQRQPIWDNFTTFEGRGLEAAHDTGHGVTGPTMRHADAAAFDPLFWLFHANWDRLWWEWQQSADATTLTTFRSTIVGPADFLVPPFNDLLPFEATVDETIDLSAMGVAYAPPVARETDGLRTFRRAITGGLRAGEAFRVDDSPRASVRLKGIDRLAIPGSFRAILRADGQIIGRRTFFQSTEPVICAACRERAKINLDFLVDVDEVRGKTLTTSIELITPDPELGATIPLATSGDPTLNVRLLLERT